MRRLELILRLSVFFNPLAIWGQIAGPRAPDQELKQLEYFVGTWSTAGTLVQTPMSPGGSVTGADKAFWQEGHYFLISKQDYTTPAGKGTTMAVLGFDPARKVFTYDSFSSDGDHEVATGTHAGNVWTWVSDQPNSPQKWRYSQAIQSERAFVSSFEVSRDAKHWTTVFRSVSARQ